MSKNDPRYCLACMALMKQDSNNTSTHTDVYQNLPRYSATEQQDDAIMVQPKEGSPCGRPRKEIPTELIRELSEQGLSIRRIVAELKAQDLAVSPMTVSRVLLRQRALDRTDRRSKRADRGTHNPKGSYITGVEARIHH